ncbi:MAG: NUDIX domain-containing protein [Verrucomicrobia bacterium]|nr:NUDIX domain-containing protein [Verrucomicrobiota bacterium]
MASISSSRPGPSTVRTAARAVILRGPELLVVRVRTDEGEFLVLPGGGQEHGETLTDTVQREVFEELGLKVVPGRLVYLREYVGKNHGMHRIHGRFHQVEAVFHCACGDFSPIGGGLTTDRRQIGFEWIPLEKLADYPLSPQGLGAIIAQSLQDGSARYLGDVH